MKSITIQVLKWKDYQGRSDIKHHTWFRCSNRILENEDFFELSDSEILAWFYILSLCSQKISDTVIVNFERAERFARRKKRDIISMVEKLQGNQLVRIPDASRTDHVRNPCTTLQDRTGQTEQDSTEHHVTGTVVRERPPDPTQIHSVEDLRNIIPAETREGWRKLYPDPQYVPREAIKAMAWCRINSRKVPKTVGGWSRFFNGWLERGWDSYRKTIESSPVEGQVGFRTISQMIEDGDAV